MFTVMPSSKSNLLLEVELGITGGEEDGVDNSDVDSSKLYTQPEEVWQVYEALSKVPNGKFTVAAAFGNVHGVYSPGNVRLEPQILHNTQKFISEKLGGDDKKPVYFVFHGGSGSSTEDSAVLGENAIPQAGFWQIVAFCGLLELGVMKDIEGTGNEFVGDFGNGSIDFGWDTFDEETKLSKRAIELNNGRAAMMGILGLMVHEELGGSIPIVGEM